MIADDVSKIIDDEIQSESDLTNVGGLDLAKCLITPVKQVYYSVFDSNVVLELWTVLEETVDFNGYKIFYDPDEKSFGLGMKSNEDKLIYLGNYGSFLRTLKAM